MNVCLAYDWVHALDILFEGKAVGCIFPNNSGGVDVVAMSEFADRIPKTGMVGNVTSFAPIGISTWKTQGYELKQLATELTDYVFEITVVDART